MRFSAVVAFHCAIFFSVFFAPFAVHAYTHTATANGQLIRWHAGQKLFLAGNPNSQENFSPSAFRNAVVNGLQQWKWATGNQFDFDYWQGSDNHVFLPNLQQNGLSSIFFASNSNEISDPNILGYTQIWYNNHTGDLVEADILLNDKDYLLTNNPHDTSSTSIGSSRPAIYINNVITHELGHAIGLSHSGDINSSMLYVEFAEQNKIGCDDWSAARHLYPSPQSNTGVLTGLVLDPNGNPLSGVMIVAISKLRGIPIATVHTDQSGTFNFGALEAGSVALAIENFQGSPASVPSRFQSKAPGLCNGSHLPTQFLTTCDGLALQEIKINAGAVTNAGVVITSCSSVSDSGNLYSQTLTPEMVVDQTQLGQSKIYHYQANGPFTITATAHLLLSDIQLDLKAYDQNGQEIALTVKSPLYQSADSPFQITDTQVSGNAIGPITVVAVPGLISLSNFPAPSIWPNSAHLYVLSFHSNPTDPISPLPNNARCAAPASFQAYTSPAGDPMKNSVSTDRSTAGFCSKANASTLHSPKGSVPTEEIFSWFFPFLIAVGVQLYFRKRTVKLET